MWLVPASQLTIRPVLPEHGDDSLSTELSITAHVPLTPAHTKTRFTLRKVRVEHRSIHLGAGYSPHSAPFLISLTLRTRKWLSSRVEAMVAIFTSIGTETQWIQNGALQNATAFCPTHNSGFALSAGGFSSKVKSLHLIRGQIQLTWIKPNSNT